MDTGYQSPLEEKQYFIIKRMHDPKCGGLVPFATAVSGGLVDRRKGQYQLASGEHISLLDAISEGTLAEAERVSGPGDLTGGIAENQMTIFRLKVPKGPEQ